MNAMTQIKPGPRDILPFQGLAPRQREVVRILAGPERHCLLYGGARSMKTFTACYAIANRALQAPNSRHVIARHHHIDVKQAVMFDTWPKMMRLAFPGLAYKSNKEDQFITLPNGAEVWFSGLDDKDRVEKILGKEYASIYANEASQISYATILVLRTRLAQSCTKANGKPLALKFYYDLNPVGRSHWTHREFVEQVRPDNGLPVEPNSRVFAKMHPKDNPHLPAEFLAELAALPERQRKRFWDGEYQSELPGTLWPLDVIEALRVAAPPMLKRIVVAVDPSGSDGTGGDRQGIIVAGEGVDGHLYVLEDLSVRKSPQGWAKDAVAAYHRWSADCIVAEVNYGGAMVESTIRAVDSNVMYRAVTASRGKHVRAEPVSALYELGKAHHVGMFPDLEEQMGMFTTAGYQGTDSPDRADALVWAATELGLVQMPGAGVLAYYEQVTKDEGIYVPEPMAVGPRAEAMEPGYGWDFSDKAAAATERKVRMRRASETASGIVYGRLGTKYVVDADGRVDVLPEDVGPLIRSGFIKEESMQ